jgi:hypothetical protein
VSRGRMVGWCVTRPVKGPCGEYVSSSRTVAMYGSVVAVLPGLLRSACCMRGTMDLYWSEDKQLERWRWLMSLCGWLHTQMVV